ncbi:MAG: leucine-rich repeat protein [Clostridia bacterium]|nr:leucine-rich repeat protein [Clostridia bacterium]MBQ6883338.1 leucine-rich repeat protein [Clostridia bacterium]
MEHHVCKCCGMLLKREGNYYVCDYCMNKWMIDVANDVSAVERVAAWMALRQGDFHKATELFEEIIIKDDKNHEAYWGRALARNAIVYVNDVVEDKKVPTCNNITEASFLNDKDVKKAIELAPEDVAVGYKKQIDYLENIRVEWLEKASKEPPYDVFISFKDSDRENGIERTKDSFDAQEIYTALVDAGYKVFFSRVSLRGKVAEQYEPYIYNAIKTAKVMIVFGEKPEYFNSTWIKNEWTRFKARIDGGEKHKNSLVVVVKDMNPGDLPIALRARQAMNMTDLTFFETLKNHIASIVGGASAQKTAAVNAVEKPKIKKPKIKKEKKPLTKKQKGIIGIASAMVGVIMILCSITLIMHIANPFRFYRYDGGYGISRYKGNESVVEIPSTYLGKPVKAIGNSSFSDNTSITSIVIPDSVTFIGDWAFSNCSSLTSIEIPDSVTSIGYSAFSGCDSLTSVVIGDSVTSISSYAFSNCSSLTSIEIPDSVTSIGSSAFEGCSSLTSIKIPDSVTSIGGYAFRGCSSLTSIVIPDSVTDIGYNVFGGCDSLESITIPFVGYGDINGKMSFTSLSSMFVYNIPDSLKTVTITGGTIGNSAFKNCDSLTSVIIGDSVTSIGESAFEGCTSLTSITIPDSVTSIGYSAFYDCDLLTSVIIPNSVTTISSYAFYNCNSLTSIVIPDSVTSIGRNAFEGCDSLESITIPFVGGGDSSSGSFSKNFAHIFGCNYVGDGSKIPASLQKVIITGGTSISSYAFENCKSITSIVIPDTVTSIGYSAFKGCSGLTSVYITDIVAWCNISFDDSTSNPLYYAKNLYLNNQLVTELVIPDNVTTISRHAFFNCDSLTSVIIGDSVTSIGSYAFRDCTSLTSVVIGDSVTSIGDYAFAYCSNLTSIKYCGTEEQWLAINKVSSWNNGMASNYTITYNYTGE